MEVKEVDSDWNEENQLVCSCQNKMADRRTVYQKTSGSTTFDPKPTTRHVYRVPDLFGQVHQERSIKALFWCLEPLLLHQPPNLIVPKKKKEIARRHRHGVAEYQPGKTMMCVCLCPYY
jgi:hypothetical protein